MSSLSHWLIFAVFFLVALAVDLGIGQRKAHLPTMKEALGWTSFWVACALAFNALIWFWAGRTVALEFLTGYIIEYSLSVDNLFVFIMIFSFFGVAPESQPRLLKWGILGAVIMRGIFIAVGAVVLQRFHWMIYLFGGFLIVTGVKMFFHKEEEVHPDKNPLVRLTCRLFPVSSAYDGSNFFKVIDGKRMATPLFIALVAIESTDVIFALDSIPAIFGVTKDPFIVFTSNIFAILGLRALFFLLAGALGLFHYLKFGISLVLVFVGAKMVAASVYHIPIEVSLGIVLGILALSVGASVAFPQKVAPPVPDPHPIPEENPNSEK